MASPQTSAVTLLDACYKGNWTILDLMLSTEGADHDVNQMDIMGQTPLYLAAHAGSTSVASLLLRRDADVNAQTIQGNTALMVACQNGFTETVQTLLSDDAAVDVNMLNGNGEGALSLACLNGHRGVILLLLNHPLTDVNVQSSSSSGRGCTPLHWAVWGGRLTVIQLLLRRAPALELDAADEEGNTALHLASSRGFDAIAHQLLRNGANAQLSSSNGVTPLHLACKNHRGPLTCALLPRYCDINIRNGEGKTPLHEAVSINATRCIQKLLQYTEIDTNVRDGNGRSALWMACDRGYEDVASKLITRGADANIADLNGSTPLHVATRGNRVHVVSLLLHHPNIQLDAQDSCGLTALNYACELSLVPIAKALIERGACVNKTDSRNITPLFWASLHDQRDLVKQILSTPHCEVNMLSDTGTTALHVAILHGHRKVVKLLLKHKADVVQPNSTSSMTPLHIAIDQGHVKLVAMLAKFSIFLDAQDFDGCTPLLLACGHGYRKVVKILLRMGADGNMADLDGTTPLMKACKNGHQDVVDLLLRNNVCRKKTDKEGCTALYYAVENGRINLVRLLLCNSADADTADLDDVKSAAVAVALLSNNNDVFLEC